MLKTPDWAAGAKYLREHAPELIPLIDRFPAVSYTHLTLPTIA